LPEKSLSVAKQKVAGVILAAGNSSRFGSNKLLVDWHGKPLIQYVAEAICKCRLAETFIVLGFQSDSYLSLLSDLPLKILINPKWHKGLSTSIRCAVKRLGNEFDGVMFSKVINHSFHVIWSQSC